MLDSIRESFTESIQTQIAAAEALPDAISKAAQVMVQSLLNGNKILSCGNGGSAANAQQLASCLINRFEIERPAKIENCNEVIDLSSINSDSVTFFNFKKQMIFLQIFFPLEKMIFLFHLLDRI